VNISDALIDGGDIPIIFVILAEKLLPIWADIKPRCSLTGQALSELAGRLSLYGWF
jgi:hypothetical protein